MQRHFQFDPPMVGPDAPILNISRQAPLIAVEINRPDPLALLEECDGQMHGQRRLPRATLLIADDDYVWRSRLNDLCRVQHRNPILTHDTHCTVLRSTWPPRRFFSPPSSFRGVQDV